MVTNDDVVELLDSIADLLELKDENVFKVRAYRRAAEQLSQGQIDVSKEVTEGTLEQHKGFGKALVEKITTFMQTGSLPYYNDLKKTVPKGLPDLLKIPNLGPRKVAFLHKAIGVKDIRTLEKACKAGEVAALKGFGQKSEDKILHSLQNVKKYNELHLLSDADDTAEIIITKLKKMCPKSTIEVCGSLRRKKEVIRDIDILAATSSPKKLVSSFLDIAKEIGAKVHNEGEIKVSIRNTEGTQIDLRIVSPKEFPTALAYFTGSKAHNTSIRGLAKKKGFTLNEYRLESLKTGKSLSVKSEEELYSKLGLPFIPPEMREDSGEIEAGQARKLPNKLIQNKDLRGILHVHTNYSDGRSTVAEMAEAAGALGAEFLGISDHSQTAVYANGLSPQRIAKQWKEIDAWNKKKKKPFILKGIESDILPDGSLDYKDSLLKEFDFIIGSVHSSFQMSEEEMTRRVITAMENPYLNIVGHPTGRLLLQREPFKLNMDEFLKAALKNQVVVEINAHPVRLDLAWNSVKKAKEMGIKLGINPDAHSQEGLALTKWGVTVARRGWLEKTDIINCLTKGKLVDFFSSQRS
ncbi:MAG: DNA polymerase/3'-5' exonuclease PolX [Candidatus Lindowbacteria bacterium]|nr:DNA polymerase/3'-5' exonuclease PolX [Candidatus Lindowbacteria bacterium]